MVAVRANAGGFDASFVWAALPPAMILRILKRGLIRDLQRQRFRWQN
jgi:hypothetical protein